MVEIIREKIPLKKKIPPRVFSAEKTMIADFPRVHAKLQSYRNCKELDELELSIVLAKAALPKEKERHFIFLFLAFCNVNAADKRTILKKLEEK